MTDRKYTTIMVERSVASELKEYQKDLAKQLNRKRIGSSTAIKELLEHVNGK